MNLLKLVCGKGSVSLLKSLKESQKTFSQLEEKMSKSTLSRRLKEMSKKQLINRRVEKEDIPPRVYYEITNKGEKVLRLIEELEKVEETL